MKPRPVFAPQRTETYLAAEENCGKHLDLLATPLKHPADPNDPHAPELAANKINELVAAQMDERALRTYVPPLSVFIGAKTWPKTVAYAVATVRLWPTLLSRVKLARTDPTVKPLGTKTWRNVIGQDYWRMVWKDEQKCRAVEKRLEECRAEREEGEDFDEEEALKDLQIEWESYDHDHFWKYGGELVFGKAESDRLKSDPHARPEIGKLPCGCDAAFNLLVEDPTLVYGLLHLFNMLRLFHWLAHLIPAKWVIGRDFSAVKEDESLEPFTPDVLDLTEMQPFLVQTIQMAAMPNMDVDKAGWPQFLDDVGGKLSVDGQKRWIENLLDVLVRARHTTAVDWHMKSFDAVDGWWSSDYIRGGGAPDDEQARCWLEEHLLLRYFLTSFATGQWPVEVHATPHAIFLKCSKCRAAAMPADGMADRFQNDEEVMDDD